MVEKGFNEKSAVIFGFVGTFGQWHGIGVLERMIPLLLAVRKNIHFLLIGDGSGRESLENSLYQKDLGNFVTFTGKILPHDTARYLARCDVFLCPTQSNKDGSSFFGSPTKLFEYMSMGKVVIASDLEQLSEIVNPAVRIKNTQEQQIVILDQVGFLVEPQNIQGFIDTCLYCMEMSVEARKKIGSNARKKVLEHYTWRQHVKKIIKHAQL
jgi:glycosyltransferase involved in cell wall biosynthesis